MKKQWYLYKKGQQHGPYAWEEIWQEAKNGGVGPEDLVWRQGLEDWVRADRIHGLVNIPDFVDKAPPPPRIANVPGTVPKTKGKAAPVAYKRQPGQEDGEKKSSNLPVILVAAAVILIPLIVGSGVFLYLTLRGPAEGEPEVSEEIEEAVDLPGEEGLPVLSGEGSTAGNVVNGGLAAVDGQWIYFRSNEGGTLQREHIFDQEKQLISADSAWFINALDEWVFYINRDDNNRIYRVKGDGRGRIALTADSAWYLTLVDDQIYYINEDDNYRIYLVDAEGEGKVALSDDSAWFLNVVDDWIYYVNRSRDDRIYRVRTDGSGLVQVNEAASCCINVLNDGWIYYINEDDGSRLYRIRTDGSGDTALNDHPSWFVNVSEDGIYYAHENDNFAIHRMDHDGGNPEMISIHPARYIVLADDWIYYLDHAAEDTVYRVLKDGTNRHPAGSAF